MPEKVIPPEKDVPPEKRAFKVVQIENVKPERKDRLIFLAQGNPQYVSHQVFPEGDGEFTIVFVYRTDD